MQSSAEQQEQQASDKEVQEMKEALAQAEAKIKALEGQTENLQKVRDFCAMAVYASPLSNLSKG